MVDRIQPFQIRQINRRECPLEESDFCEFASLQGSLYSKFKLTGVFNVRIARYDVDASYRTFLHDAKRVEELTKKHINPPSTFWQSYRTETCISYCFSMPEDNAREINGKVSHPASFLFLTPLGFVTKLPFSRWISRGQLALVYDSQKRISRALLLSPLDCLLLKPLLEELETNTTYCSHPLAVPLALVKVVLEASDTRLDETDGDLNDITKSTGQHRWLNVPVGNPLEIDFMATTRDLNNIGKRIAAETAILTSMTNTLRIMREFAKTIEQLNAGQLSSPERVQIMILQQPSWKKRCNILLKFAVLFLARRNTSRR